MTEASAPEAAKPKKHDPFAQVAYRKTGEAFDLAGKGLVGLSGLNLFASGAHVDHGGVLRLIVCVAFGGGLLAIGIYLQAKAEETS